MNFNYPMGGGFSQWLLMLPNGLFQREGHVRGGTDMRNKIEAGSVELALVARSSHYVGSRRNATQPSSQSFIS